MIINRKAALAVAAAVMLSGCSYRTMTACEQATGEMCHESIMGGFFRGPGIDVNSPAGQAILYGAFVGMQQPTYQQPTTIYLQSCTLNDRIARQC